MRTPGQSSEGKRHKEDTRGAEGAPGLRRAVKTGRHSPMVGWREGQRKAALTGLDKGESDGVSEVAQDGIAQDDILAKAIPAQPKPPALGHQATLDHK